jgi:hypothetical protein
MSRSYGGVNVLGKIIIPFKGKEVCICLQGHLFSYGAFMYELDTI